MQWILIKCQLNGLAAGCKRNLGVITQHYLNIAFSFILLQDLHAGDTHIRPVQGQRATAKLRTVARNRVIRVSNRAALRDIVGHKQGCGLVRKQVQACELLLTLTVAVANLCRNFVEYTRSLVGHGELHRHGKAGDHLGDIHISRHIRCCRRESADRQLQGGDRLAVENIEGFTRGIGVVASDNFLRHVL